jgi:hypothetical protein
MNWQGQQPWLLFGEDLGNGTTVVSRPGALVCDLVTPEQSLPVALGKRSEDTARPKGFANITNGAFHAAFLITGADLTGARSEVIVRAQLQQARVEMNLVASAFEYRAAEVVV